MPGETQRCVHLTQDLCANGLSCSILRTTGHPLAVNHRDYLEICALILPGVEQCTKYNLYGVK